GEYIMYLNNDTIIQTPFLESLVRRMQIDGKVGAVSPKIKYYSNPHIIQYAGYSPMSKITMRNNLVGTNQTDNGQYDTAHRVPFIHGACVLTSRAVLEDVGTMTELYFLFYEELDWSVALSNKGYELWYEPDSTVYHKESMTIQRTTSCRTYYLARSRMIFTRRRSSSKILAIAYQLVMSFPAHIIKYILHRQWDMALALSRGILAGLHAPINKK
ncbi:MAG: glycosyltransferase family 2 protein, partial [Mucinivorans sp.]